MSIEPKPTDNFNEIMESIEHEHILVLADKNLDELVCDMHKEQAAEVIANGVRAQVAYLVGQGITLNDIIEYLHEESGQ